MWVFLNKAFVSIIEDRQNPGNLLVRGRRLNDVQNFVTDKFSVVINHTPGRDYEYRTSMSKHDVGACLMDHATSIDYSNFKDSIEDDDALHDMASETWSSGYRNLDSRSTF